MERVDSEVLTVTRSHAPLVLVSNLLIAAMLALGACTAQVGPEVVLDHADDEVSLSASALQDDFEVVGEHLVSPRITPPLGASRVGVLVTVGDSAPMPSVEARALEGELPGAWVPLAVTFTEAGHHVAVADLPAHGDAAQIRIRAAEAPRITSLKWNATLPVQEETVTEEGTDLGASREALRSDLAAAGVVSREGWRARRTRCSSTDRSRYRMAIHETVTPSGGDVAATVRSIQSYHMDSRGWCDVGYHFLIGADGTIYEGRPLPLRGAHVGGHNTGNVGISLVGCFHPSGCSGMGPLEPTEAMIASTARLVGLLADTLGVTVTSSSVIGHREHRGASTACPGDYLARRLGEIRTRALDGGSATGGAEPAPTTGGGGTGSGSVSPPASAGACATATCGGCDAVPGCGWCGSRGACAPTDGSCVWDGQVGGGACYAELWPCWMASCWNPTTEAPRCGARTIAENFSSGRFSVHRWRMRLEPGGPVTLTLRRTAGSFDPALVVADYAGRLVSAGEVADLHASVRVLATDSGRSGAPASVTLETPSAIDVFVYVTGWSILDAGFGGRLGRDVRYELGLTQRCGAP